MPRLIYFLFGAGMFVIGISSYAQGIPVIVNCSSTLCKIGSSIITVDMVLMGFGVLLLLIAFGMSKK